MRTLGKIAATVGVVGAIGVTGVNPASAFEVYVGPRHHHYYDYYGGWRAGNGCRPGWTVQGGVCKPYQKRSTTAFRSSLRAVFQT
jgi:hypothetical protein